MSPYAFAVVTSIALIAALSAGAKAADAPPPSPHCTLIQSAELQAIVGDCARDGSGGKQYCGLWSLTSKSRQFNAFGNSYAGLLPGELRGRPNVVLQPGDDQSAALYKAPTAQDPTEARVTYRFVSPNCLEHTLTVKDGVSRMGSLGYREVSWCS
jgi:hypothetical protein